MSDSFLDFYKSTADLMTKTHSLPSQFNKLDKITKNTRTHHQSTTRLTNMGHRKSGKMNLVAASENESVKHPLINRFTKTGSLKIPKVSFNIMKPILQMYRIKHDEDNTEPYTRSLGGIKCDVTGKKIYVKFYPETNLWDIFKH